MKEKRNPVTTDLLNQFLCKNKIIIIILVVLNIFRHYHYNY